jgi:hypothetical protein
MQGLAHVNVAATCLRGVVEHPLRIFERANAQFRSSWIAGPSLASIRTPFISTEPLDGTK